MKIICITPIKHLEGLYDELCSFGEVLYEPYIKKKELRELLLRDKNTQYMFTNPNKLGFMLDEELLKDTAIKVINTASTGLNHIDVEYCNKAGIKVLSLKEDYNLLKQLPSTAELAVGLMLSLFRFIPQSLESVKNYEWNYEKFLGKQARGSSAGIVGFGRLGHFTAKYCNALGMKVLVCDPYKLVFDYDQVSLEEIAKKSDVVLLHVHVKEDTKKMINKKFITQMKDNSYVINTSRGEIVDEYAIVEALKSGKLAGYGTDVVTDEFGTLEKSPIIKAAKEGLNVIAVPHTGGMTLEGQRLAFKYTVQKFKNVDGCHKS